MDFANPAGLWALLGIPAVLAIHFLQRRARKIPISTRFLLERTHRESISGRRFERLLPSVPLWLQLLAVLLITWLLAAPRFPRSHSVQRVAVVLDSSASMIVFRENLEQTLARELPELSGNAERMEISILDDRGRRLHRGDSADRALASLADWHPHGGLSDPLPALRVARSLVGAEGTVVWATDTPLDPVPFDGRLLAVGEPVGNVGVTGLRVESDTRRWHALVKNYGSSRSSRSWHLGFPDGSTSQPATATIEAGTIVSLGGRLPEGVDRAVLVLESDRFPLDDRVPLLVPHPRMLGLRAEGPPAVQELLERIAASLEAVETEGSDLALLAIPPGGEVPADENAITFIDDPRPDARPLTGEIIAERHPLVDGLNWRALQVRGTDVAPPRPDERVLLRQGARPLVVLRETAADESGQSRQQIRFLFDLTRSNATRLPAFIVCLHRFAESVRATRIAEMRANLETGQPIEFAARADGPAVLLELRDPDGDLLEQRSLQAEPRVLFEAPLEPGFLELRQGDTRLLTASLHFADSREADFTACATRDNLAGASAAARETHSVEDPWWRIWLLLVLACALLSWCFSASPGRPQPTSAP